MQKAQDIWFRLRRVKAFRDGNRPGIIPRKILAPIVVGLVVIAVFQVAGFFLTKTVFSHQTTAILGSTRLHLARQVANLIYGELMLNYQREIVQKLKTSLAGTEVAYVEIIRRRESQPPEITRLVLQENRAKSEEVVSAAYPVPIFFDLDRQLPWGRVDFYFDDGPNLAAMARLSRMFWASGGSQLAAVIVVLLFVLRRLRRIYQTYQQQAQRLVRNPELAVESGAVDDVLLHDLRELSATLNEKNRLLEERTRLAAIGKLAGLLAHDVKKPFHSLRTAMGMIELMRDEPQVMEEVKESIDRSIKKVDGMLKDILNVSRDVALETRPLPLIPVLLHAVRETAAVYPDTRVKLETRLRHTRQPLLDEDRIWRVFFNILTNSVEALAGSAAGGSPAKNPPQHTLDKLPGHHLDTSSPILLNLIPKNSPGTITIFTQDDSLDPARPGVSVILGNDGPPFDEEIISQLFDATFTQGKRSGTGLGLASAKKIVELHGGTITARNRSQREGVELVLWLPASAEVESRPVIGPPTGQAPDYFPASLKEALQQGQESRLGNNDADLESRIKSLTARGELYRILFLEDEAVYRVHVRNLVQNHFLLNKIVRLYDVQTVEEALEVAGREKLHYAIVDLDLGGGQSGFDFLEKSRQLGISLQVMMHTHQHPPNDQEPTLAAGTGWYAPKPLLLEHLVRLLAG